MYQGQEVMITPCHPQERSMSMPTRPASQAGNPRQAGEEAEMYGGESPRLEVGVGHCTAPLHHYSE